MFLPLDCYVLCGDFLCGVSIILLFAKCNDITNEIMSDRYPCSSTVP